MTETQDLHQSAVAPASESRTFERRRPGRPENVSPELVSLLRGTANPPPPLEFSDRSEDQLDPLRGLAVGLVISAVLWALLLRFVF